MNHAPNSGSRIQRAQAYSRYAAVYDRIGQRIFGERIAEATLAFLAEQNVYPNSVIDLACGTGAATLVFAREGLAVTGVDLSNSMLEVACQAGIEAGIYVTWRQQDMRQLTVVEPVDLVTCFYDGINYLIEIDDLDVVFSRVWDALLPDGYFIFDLNTREKFDASWNDSCQIATNREEIFGVYQSWYEADTGLSPLILTFFVRQEDGSWDRFDEEHLERAFELELVKTRLIETGFTVNAMLDYSDRSPRFGKTGSESSHRVVFVVRKPSPEESLLESKR